MIKLVKERAVNAYQASSICTDQIGLTGDFLLRMSDLKGTPSKNIRCLSALKRNVDRFS